MAGLQMKMEIEKLKALVSQSDNGNVENLKSELDKKLEKISNDLDINQKNLEIKVQHKFARLDANYEKVLKSNGDYTEKVLKMEELQCKMNEFMKNSEKGMVLLNSRISVLEDSIYKLNKKVDELNVESD